MTAPDIAAIALEMGETQRGAWKNAEWQGEYYAPPYLVEHNLWCGSWAVVFGLAVREGDEFYVTHLGEELIRYLNRPPLWRRALSVICTYLPTGEPRCLT